MDLCCRNPLTIHAFSLLLIWCTVPLFSEATNNTITQGELVRDGQVILSEGQIFALGFFNPENSTSRYVGIWYYRIPVQTVVWVANRDNPIRGESGVLTIGSGGNLIVLDGTSNSSIVWSTNISSPSTNSTAILTDTGDLVLSRSEDLGDTSRALWQSFNNPTDTYIPNMRAHMNASTGESRIFSSWASPNDPSHGNYSWGLDPRGSPQIVIWERSNRRWRTGYWNGLVFTGVPSMRALYLYGFSLTTGAGGDMYFTYTMSNSSLYARFQIQWNGFTEQLIWNDALRQWNVTMRHPSNVCDLYNTCGDFGVCSVTNSPICTCVTGFEPRNASEWGNRIWNGGCVRRRALQCDGNGTGDGFGEVRGVKLPDYADTSLDDNMSMNECREQCLRNCSCRAYAYVTGIQCMIWSSDLVDIEQFEDGGEQLYIRLADSELGGNTRLSNVAIILIALAGAIFLGFMWVLWRFRAKLKGIFNSWRKSKKTLTTDVNKSQEISAVFSAQDELDFDGKQDGSHLPLFNFNFVEVATDYFANKNKLGQGGFGPVYKGTLPSGQEIAVKRLSKWSGQGQEEFKNEMILIAKLQHRNLVRLLGCCIEGEEKLLIYEYMPNKSLDSFLFDPDMKAQLDWRKRFTIIEGIARGILYLHRDSILRIIHRDLKASNILLDEEMQPKISDFGMARIFGGNQNEANTIRVVGTYGYMSPEYAMEGLFSVKSDVYSFGVLLLEIVSGQRNNSFRSPECSNLIRYAWNLWNEGKAIELIDPTIADSCSQKEVLQCIHVGMLCVQVSAAQRPTMPSVMLMLESENSSLPMPRQPDPNSMNSMDMESFIHDHDIISSTDVTFTEVGGR